MRLAFSKKRENFEAAVALHFAHYNFVKRHNTLRCTAAMAAGAERDFLECWPACRVCRMTYIEELRETIRRLHGTDSTHIQSVPVKETHAGQIIWEGIVEIFELHGHPKATHAYMWGHQTDDPKKPKRHVAVLKIQPVVSPETAVRAAIVQEFRDAQA